MTKNAVRTVATAAVATLVASALSAPAGAQVSRGQQIEVLGITYEIVSFEFRAFDTGELYELLMPAETLVHDDGDTSQQDLSTTVQVLASSSFAPFCESDVEPNHQVGGFPAFVPPDMVHYVMSHTYSEVQSPLYGDMAQGRNSLSYWISASVFIRVNEATCVHVSFGSPFFGHSVDEDVDRGVHSLARDHAPTLSDLERYRQEQLTLLGYVHISRR